MLANVKMQKVQYLVTYSITFRPNLYNAIIHYVSYMSR